MTNPEILAACGLKRFTEKDLKIRVVKCVARGNKIKLKMQAWHKGEKIDLDSDEVKEKKLPHNPFFFVDPPIETEKGINPVEALKEMCLFIIRKRLSSQ